MTEQRIPVIVLAGGASRRMGTDKRLVQMDGEPMLLRVVGRLAPWPTLLVLDPSHPTDLILPPHACVVADTRPGEGPLAALEAGLRATAAPIVLVVAGDMPWLLPTVLELLAAHLSETPATDIACLADEGGVRPLPLALRREPVLERLIPLLDTGERRLRALLAHPAVLHPAAWLPLDPTRGTLMDVDTPADLARAG